MTIPSPLSEPSMKHHVKDLHESKDKEIFEHLEDDFEFKNSLFSNNDGYYCDDEEENTLTHDDLMPWCSDILAYIEDNPSILGDDIYVNNYDREGNTPNDDITSWISELCLHI